MVGSRNQRKEFLERNRWCGCRAHRPYDLSSAAESRAGLARRRAPEEGGDNDESIPGRMGTAHALREVIMEGALQRTCTLV